MVPNPYEGFAVDNFNTNVNTFESDLNYSSFDENFYTPISSCIENAYEEKFENFVNNKIKNVLTDIYNIASQHDRLGNLIDTCNSSYSSYKDSVSSCNSVSPKQVQEKNSDGVPTGRYVDSETYKSAKQLVESNKQKFLENKKNVDEFFGGGN